MFWYLLFVLAIISYFLHQPPSAVGGGAMIGLIVGTVGALWSEELSWWFVAQSVTVGALLGTGLQWIPEVFNYLGKKFPEKK